MASATLSLTRSGEPVVRPKEASYKKSSRIRRPFRVTQASEKANRDRTASTSYDLEVITPSFQYLFKKVCLKRCFELFALLEGVKVKH